VESDKNVFVKLFTKGSDVKSFSTAAKPGPNPLFNEDFSWEVENLEYAGVAVKLCEKHHMFGDKEIAQFDIPLRLYINSEKGNSPETKQLDNGERLLNQVKGSPTEIQYQISTVSIQPSKIQQISSKLTTNQKLAAAGAIGAVAGAVTTGVAAAAISHHNSNSSQQNQAAGSGGSGGKEVYQTTDGRKLVIKPNKGKIVLKGGSKKEVFKFPPSEKLKFHTTKGLIVITPKGKIKHK